MDLALLRQQIRNLPAGLRLGRVTKVVGLIVESRGPEGAIGEQMLVRTDDGREIAAEVVGFNDKQVLLMPIENMDGLARVPSRGVRVPARPVP